VEAELEVAFALAGAIYDAALDPTQWVDVLEGISGFVGGPASALSSHDVARKEARFHFISGDNPEYSRSYQETYVHLNPCLTQLLAFEPGEIVVASMSLPRGQMYDTRFYREWVEPQGYGDSIGALVAREGTVITMLSTSLNKAESPAGPDAVRRMELIVPHVRRALAIGNAIEMKEVEADSLGDAVDGIGAAVYLVREGGELVRTNPAGRELLESGSLFRQVRGRLIPEERGRDHVLMRAIAHAAQGGLCTHGAIPLIDRDGTRFVAHVLPLVSGKRARAGRVTGAAVAVFIHRAVMDCAFPIEAISRQFELSKTELRVLSAMIEVGPPSEVAPVLGISEASVRTHLRRLFEKTGTTRQADLVKLVAGYASPIVGQMNPA
jgi:DNA-binding CsgD family transcriptional regulator/PAS domain-containing protein